MTTSTYNGFPTSTNDAEFRVWTKDISDNLQACGLVKTTDTGQINFTIVNRPTVANTAAGYEIYRFSDSLQSTAPVFIKIEYGVGMNANMPALWLTVGTASSGSGVMSGINTTRFNMFFNRFSYTPQLTVNQPTKICVLPGYVMVQFKIGGYVEGNGLNIQPLCIGFFLIGRTVDQDNGANDGRGVVVYRYYGESNTNLGFIAQTLNFSTGAQLPANNYTEHHHVVPFDVGSSLVAGTDVQLYRHMFSLPDVGYLPWICTYLLPEISQGAVFPAALIGSTERQMLALGTSGTYSGANRNYNHCNAVVFE